MKITTLVLASLSFIFISCTQTGKQEAAQTDSLQTKIKVPAEGKVPLDSGTIAIADTAQLKTLEAKDLINQHADGSSNYLRHDNYFVDQFSCVVEGYGYKRLTNIHPTRTITGKVIRSWVYQNHTVTDEVPFTLAPKEWKHFGCFFVTQSQPITFTIQCAFQ